MKKLLFIAVLAMASLVSNAQVFVGGGLGASVTSVKPTEGASSYSTTNLTFKPEVGYKFGKAAVGARCGVYYTSVESADNTSLTFEAFGRYNFINAQRIHLGAELGAGYLSKGNDAGGGLIIALRPVLTFDLSKKASVYASSDLLQYTSYNKKAGNGSIFGVGLLGGTSTVSIGIMFDL